MLSQYRGRVNAALFISLFASFCGAVARPTFGQTFTGTPGTALTNAVINFSSLATNPALFATSTTLTSSPPAITFQAVDDDATQDPPFPGGAAGPNHIVTMLDNRIRIQKRDGTILSTITLQQFWAALGPYNDARGAFDPKVLYDPFQGRWMTTAVADFLQPTSAILIGVSQTSDPTGNWNLYRVSADTNGLLWANYPTFGFNANWIGVGVTAFSISPGGQESQLYVFDKANLYAGGAGHYTEFTSTDIATFGTVQQTATSYDNTQTNLYLLAAINGDSGGNGIIQMFFLDGAVGSEVLHVGTRVSVADPWGDGPPTFEFAPQLGSAQLLGVDDSRLSEPVYRNGAVWVAHTIFLPPPDGGTNNIATRSAIQWWQIGADGTVLQRGRIDDPTGERFYGYPSIAVNQNDDALIGYTRFSASNYPAAYFSFRAGADSTNTLHGEVLLKAGEAPYDRSDRWGDHSSTVVDPVNDTDFWTIQEYAASPIKGIARWGTWWGDVLVGPHIITSNAVVVSETCSPTNGVADPFEHASVRFFLSNIGGQDATNVVATLLATGGVTSPGLAHNFGTITAGGPAATNVLSFLVDAPCGSNVVTSLQLQSGAVDLGTTDFRLPVGVANSVLTQNFDAVSAPALPGSWSTTGGGILSGWITVTNVVDTAPNAAFCPDTNDVGEAQLISPTIAITSSNAHLVFRNNYNLELGFDGGVLEIKIGGGSFQDILDAGGSFVQGGYSHVIDTNATGSSIGGRPAWSGDSGGWLTTVVDLPAAAAGQNVQLRWLCATDADGGGNGWWIDRVEVDDGGVCCTTGSEADLGITKSASANPVLIGSNLTYTITVTNSGPGIAFDTTVTDTPPASVTFISVVPSVGNCVTDSFGHIVCDLKDLTNGTTASITIVVNAGSLGSVTNIARASAFGPDPDLSNNTATNVVVIVATNSPPQMVVTPGNRNFGLLPVGQSSNQTFSVANAGLQTLNGTVTASGVPFGIVSGSPFSINSGQTGLVTVSFSPVATGTFTGSVVFAGNGGISTNAVIGSGAVTPTASFTGTPTTGAATLLVNFTDGSSGTVTSRFWAFGDGGTSILTSPSHSYTNAGAFSVSLTVLGPLGSNTQTRSSYITVTNFVAAPVAAFTASPTSGAVPLLVNFNDVSTGTITNRSWTFGDGGTSTTASPGHTYTNAGNFNVALTVRGPGGSSVTNRVNLISATNVVTIPLSVSILRPANGMLYPPLTNLTITIVARAIDSAAINKIEFFADATNLGSTTSNPGTNLWHNPTLGAHVISARAIDALGVTNISSGVHITVGAKNSPLGDWEVTIAGADKGAEYLTFEDDFTASGFGIRLKTVGLDDVTGQWGFNTKGQVTGPFLEQTGSTTNWTGTFLGTAKSLRSVSGTLPTLGSGIFRLRGVPATTFPDLSGTWTGVVTVVRTVAPPVSYIITENANDSGVFDIATSAVPGTVVGQLIVTSRGLVYGYLVSGGKQITLSGRFNSRRLTMILTGKDTIAERVRVTFSR